MDELLRLALEKAKLPGQRADVERNHRKAEAVIRREAQQPQARKVVRVKARVT
jgi:hypothetical protein